MILASHPEEKVNSYKFLFWTIFSKTALENSKCSIVSRIAEKSKSSTGPLECQKYKPRLACTWKTHISHHLSDVHLFFTSNQSACPITTYHQSGLHPKLSHSSMMDINFGAVKHAFIYERADIF